MAREGPCSLEASMRTHAFKQNGSREPGPSLLTRRGGPASAPLPTRAEGPHLPLSPEKPPRVGHDFGQIRIQPAPGVIQTRPLIRQSGDRYEDEADHVSEYVMRLAGPQVTCARAYSSACPSSQTEQEGGERGVPKTRTAPSGSPTRTEMPPTVEAVLRSTGQPLDATVRAFMEPRFGHDFSQVRVHADTKAAESARGWGTL